MKKIAIVLLFIISAKCSFAQWSTGGVVLCDSSIHASKDFRGIVQDGEGGYICVWIDDREGGRGIYAQRIDSLGYIMFEENGRLILHSTRASTIVSDREGGFFIIYGNDSCYIQRVDNNLNKLWGDIGVFLTNDDASSFDKVLVKDDYMFILLHNSLALCAKFHLSGDILWDSLLVVSDSSIASYGGQLRGVPNNSGGIIMIFSKNSIFDIYLQVIDSSGFRVLGDTGIPLASGGVEPWGGGFCGNIVSDDSGGAFIAWGWRDYWPMMQHVDSIGNLLWGSEGRLIVDTMAIPGYCGEVRLIKNTTGGFFANFVQGRRKQSVNYEGDTLWGGWGRWYRPIDSTPSYFDFHSDSLGGFYIQYIYYSGEYIQRFDSFGYPMWEEPLYFDDTTLSFWFVENDGEVIIECLYFRNLGLIKVSPDGYVLNCPESPFVLNDKYQDYSLNNYPNPFNSSTTFRLNIYNHNEVKIQIYNILGEHILELFDGYLDKGNHKIEWYGKDKNDCEVPSGVYLVCAKIEDRSMFKKIIKLN